MASLAYKACEACRAGALLATWEEITEEEKHHPAILIEWSKVTVTWWTHKIARLHANDFIMAAKTDDRL